MKSKQEISKRVNKNTLFAGVDVGMRNHNAYFKTSDGREVKTFEFTNTQKGFHLFLNKLEAAKRAFGKTHVLFGFESTGVYAQPLVHFLASREIDIVQVNPAHTKRAKELIDNSPSKSDTKDPKVIVGLLQMNSYLSVIIPRGEAAELRRLAKGREFYVEQKKRFINRLHAALVTLYPEFLRAVPNIQSKSARYLLAKYPQPHLLAGANLEELEREVSRVSYGKFKRERLKELYSASKTSICTLEGGEGGVFEVRCYLKELEEIIATIADFEKRIAQCVNTIDYAPSLLSIPGVGTLTAGIIIGEVADFHNFESHHQIIKLAGLNFCENSSGSFNGRLRISRRGRPLLRRTLYYVCLSLIRDKGYFEAYYKKLTGNGMAKKAALVGLARKLIRVMFVLVAQRRQFEADYNSKKMKEVDAA